MQVNPLASAASSSSNPLPGNSTSNMFMQLLTTQLQNQDPLNPVDPSAFTSQLVQFNMLDQLTQINQTLANAFSPASAATSQTAGSSVATKGAQ